MKIKQLLLGVLFLSAVGNAQNSKKEVLFTIDEKPYYTDEFLRVYNKNLDLVKDESQKDLDQYLELFIGYKLKINKAHKLGLQNGNAYKSELASYRTQLSKNYLTDSKVTKELVDEAYQHTVKEVRASHILFLVDENATPADTLKAYNQALEIRKKAMSGSNFDELAVNHSQDPSAKENKGDLGYFSAFRMVYAFESAAYKLKPGEISLPLRTRFGYHLIKVTDVRQNRGELTVAHIMVLNPEDGNEQAKQAARSKIFDIHKKLQQGESFESLAQQFSDDKSSSAKGGVLNRFGSGQLSSEEFENAAFALTAEKRISEPVETQFGWHILKLIEKFPVRSFQDMSAELENRVGKDERSRLIAESLNETLKKKYPVKRNEKVYKAVSAAVTDAIYAGNWEVPTDKKFDDKLLTIKDSTYSGKQFLNFMRIQQKVGVKDKPLSKLVEKVYDKYLNEQLHSYHNGSLETDYPEFAAVMDEYRDGLLLFELMEKEIWTRSKSDTIGLQAFYEANKMKYQWNQRADVVIASSTNQDMVKKAQKFLKQNKDAEFIKSKLNTSDKINIMTTAGTFEQGNESLPKSYKFENGVSDIIKDGEYYFVVKTAKVMPAGTKTLDEAKGRVINDYQQNLEENWVKDLKNEFKVTVNRDTFAKVKASMPK